MRCRNEEIREAIASVLTKYIVPLMDLDTISICSGLEKPIYPIYSDKIYEKERVYLLSLACTEEALCGLAKVLDYAVKFRLGIHSSEINVEIISRDEWDWYLYICFDENIENQSVDELLYYLHSDERRNAVFVSLKRGEDDRRGFELNKVKNERLFLPVEKGVASVVRDKDRAPLFEVKVVSKMIYDGPSYILTGYSTKMISKEDTDAIINNREKYKIKYDNKLREIIALNCISIATYGNIKCTLIVALVRC